MRLIDHSNFRNLSNWSRELTELDRQIALKECTARMGLETEEACDFRLASTRTALEIFRIR